MNAKTKELRTLYTWGLTLPDETASLEEAYYITQMCDDFAEIYEQHGLGYVWEKASEYTRFFALSRISGYLANGKFPVPNSISLKNAEEFMAWVASIDAKFVFRYTGDTFAAYERE